MKAKKQGLIGAAFVIIAGILWGLTGIFVRFFTALELSSIQISIFKLGFATVLLLLYCLIFNRDALKINIKDIWVFLCTGVISLDFFTYCYFSTIQQTTMSVAAVLLYLSPVVVMLLSAIIFKEKITWKKIAACFLAVLGCLLVSGILGSEIAVPGKAILTGILSAIGYGLYSIFGEIALRKGYKPLTITTYTFVIATAGILFFLEPQEIAAAAAKTQTWKFIGMALVISIVVSLLPYLFYTNGLSKVTPSKAAIMASIEPITATIVGALVFGETPDIYGIIGIICVILAIVLLNAKKIFGKNKKAKRKSEEDK